MCVCVCVRTRLCVSSLNGIKTARLFPSITFQVKKETARQILIKDKEQNVSLLSNSSLFLPFSALGSFVCQGNGEIGVDCE